MATAVHEPRIVAFFCNWCTYTASDLAGTARLAYEPNAPVIRVMCSGRVDPQFVLKALDEGADGVLIGGCHPGDCHYQEGNYKALRRFRLLKRVLDAVRRRRRARAPGVDLGERGRPRAARDQRDDGPAAEAGPLAPRKELTMADKPKVAFYWCASCGGCEEAVVDLEEQILKVVDAVDIVLWPVRDGLQAAATSRRCPTSSIAVAFINGGIRMSEQEEWVHMLRKKAQMVVAFGACAHMGGIPGLANLTDRQEVFETVYQDVPSQDNAARTVPGEHTKMNGHNLELPTFWDTVKALDQVIDVDYYLPGCAPPPKLIWGAIEAILTGNLPPKGAVLSPNKACCDDCPRKDTQARQDRAHRDQAPGDAPGRPGDCASWPRASSAWARRRAAGCGNPCIEGNMPCRGCMGPMDDVFDQGAKFLSAFASVLAPKTEAEIDALLDQIPDPAGTFYRFSLPKSLLHRRNMGATV